MQRTVSHNILLRQFFRQEIFAGWLSLTTFC
jgi:hypothetical protein